MFGKSSAQPYVFISYAREQRSTAEYIQKFLENYHYPKKFIKDANRIPGHPKYLRKVFLDVTDLRTSTNTYKKDIKSELKAARYLLVLCSQDSAHSKAVQWEIDTFLENHSENDIIPVALQSCNDDCIPERLHCLRSRNIPRWSLCEKMTHPNNTKAIFGIIEFLLQIDGRFLHNRYDIALRKKLKTVFLCSISVLLLIIGALSFGIYELELAKQHEKARAEFEQSVFPYSIVSSYCRNFLFDLASIAVGKHEATCSYELPRNAYQNDIDQAKKIAVTFKPAEKCIVIIAMPLNYAELSNQIDKKTERFSKDAQALKWSVLHRTYFLPSNKRRPIAMMFMDSDSILSSNPDYTKVRVYADMVSTVSSIKAVVDHLTKPNNPFYSQNDKETLSLNYIQSFKTQIYEELKKTESLESLRKNNYPDYMLGLNKKCEVHFVADENDLRQVIQHVEKLYNK